MTAKQLLIWGSSVFAAAGFGPSVAQERPREMQQYIQTADIEIDAAQLENYKAAVREQIETAVRVEPGVLVLYAVSEKDDPTRVKVFEIYRDMEAYQSHLQSAHFKKYKAATEKMVKSLKLIRTNPIALGAKSN